MKGEISDGKNDLVSTAIVMKASILKNAHTAQYKTGNSDQQGEEPCDEPLFMREKEIRKEGIKERLQEITPIQG